MGLDRQRINVVLLWQHACMTLKKLTRTLYNSLPMVAHGMVICRHMLMAYLMKCSAQCSVECTNMYLRSGNLACTAQPVMHQWLCNVAAFSV